jgi:hypothetical protein
MTTRPGYEHILDVLPKIPMHLEVDLNSHLAAFFIRDILDSAHGFILARSDAEDAEFISAISASLREMPYFPALNRFSASAQFTTLHHAAIYSGRRF